MEEEALIQFACPSCKSACAVDDKFKGRKIKCPKCGARVLHIQDARVELLTGGIVMPPPPPPAPGAAPIPSPLDDVTPIATAVVPHSVGEFVGQSESKQNVLIVGGLIGLFAAILCILGIAFDKPILAVSPVAAVLTIAAVWLWMRKKKMERKIAEKTPKPPGPGAV